METTLCEACGTRSATRVITRREAGGARPVYLCETCAGKASIDAPAALKEPCDICRKAEGRVKLTRIIGSRRVVSFVCRACAMRRR